MMKPFAKILLGGLLTMTLAACQNNSLTGTSYTRDEVRQVQTLQKGVIIDIVEINIERQNSGIGAAAGAAVGAIAWDNKNGQVERRILQVLTGIAGGIVGEFVERKITTKSGYELVVDLDSGESISIVQEADINMPFQVGDIVRVVERGNTVRVVRTRG